MSLVVFAVLVFVLLNFYQVQVRNFFYSISAPIQKYLWKTGDNNKIEELEKKNQELLLEISQLKEFKKENETLRKALEINLPQDFNLLYCEIIGKYLLEDSLLIDKGEQDGVQKGMPLVNEQKVLVGRVSEVYKNFSKILLISGKDSTFDAKVSGTDIYGAIKGKGNLKIQFELVPMEKELKVGDLVVSAALGGIFPEGLLVGEILSFSKSESEPFQIAQIKAPLNINATENLFLIKGYK